MTDEAPHCVLVGDVPIHYQPGNDQHDGIDELEVRGPFPTRQAADDYGLRLDRYTVVVLPLNAADAPDAMLGAPESAQSQVEYLIDLTATLTARVKADSVQEARDEVLSWRAYDPNGLPLTEITVNAAAVVEPDPFNPASKGEIPDPDLFGEALHAIRVAGKAAEGDSNDSEIGLLWNAVYRLASLVGINADHERFEARNGT